MANATALLTPDLPIGPPSDESLFEIIDGQRVEGKTIGARQTVIATILSYYMLNWGLREHGLTVTEMLFSLPGNPRQRRPDVACVSYKSWPRNRRIPDDAAWAIVPELAVEIVSPTNTFNEIVDKLHEYFQAGTQLVWVVLPSQEQVYVYTSPTSNRILTRSDELTAEPLLAGFRLPLGDLFGDAN